jgi:hypothetical protein
MHRHSSSKAGFVFFQDAKIHDYEHPSLAGFLCGFFVNDFFLHPNGGNL